MDRTWKADGMDSSVAGSNSDGLLAVETPEGVSVHRPRQDCVRYRGNLRAAVTTADANVLRCVRQTAARRNAICLEMDGGRFEHLLQPRGAQGLII